MFETEKALVAEQALLQMQDRVAIRRGNAGMVTDPDTLVVSAAPQTDVWAGAAHCKVATPNGDVAVGPSNIAVRAMNVSIPPDAPLIAVNDVVTVTQAADPQLATGSTWRVVGVQSGGFWAAVVSLSCVEQYPSNYWTAEEGS